MFQMISEGSVKIRLESALHHKNKLDIKIKYFEW